MVRIFTCAVLVTAASLVDLEAEEAVTVAGEGGPGIHFDGSIVLVGDDRIILERYIQHGVDFVGTLNLEKVRARCIKSCESLCWVDFKFLDCSLLSFELTGDVQYLNNFHRAFSLYREIMRTGNDDFLGWYGLPLEGRRLADSPELHTDEIQSNFQAMRILAHWVQLAKGDEQYAVSMKKEISDALAILEDHIFPKWDARGYYIDLGVKGGVYKGLDFPLEDVRTLSHEKLSIVVAGLLALHDASGKDIYLQRAIQLGFNLKNRLSLKDGHYEWMSWEASGAWDIHATQADSWKAGWMAPDPNGGWYASTMSMVVKLHERGLVFNDSDMQRFIETQKRMCWNGDMNKPVYRNVAGQKNKWVKGRFLSYELAAYDLTIDALAFAGPHEAEVLKKSENPWHGGANATSYVRNKFIHRRYVLGKSDRLKSIGEKFLGNIKNKAWYNDRDFELTAPGHRAFLKPSQMFAKD